MAVAAGTEGGVFGTAGWVAWHGDARPVVDRASGCARRGGGQRSWPERRVTGAVPSLRRRGSKASASSVARTIRPTPGREARIATSAHGSSSWWKQPGPWSCGPSVGEPGPVADESEPLGDASDVSDGGLGGSRRDRDRGLAQPAEHLSGVNTSHAMASVFLDAAGLGGRGSGPQFEEPWARSPSTARTCGCSPELLTHAVYQPGGR